MLAWNLTGTWSPVLTLCALLSAILIQVATNFFNDALDFKKGADTAARLGPVRVTASGLLTPRRVVIMGVVMLALACAGKAGDSGADGSHLYPNDWQALGRRWVGPYLDLEPGLSFALVDGAAVVGYVLASADTEQMYRALKTWYFPRLASHFPDPLAGDCPSSTESEREVWGEYHRPSLSLPAGVSADEYPAHLHIDLAASAQRKGCGTIMINVITANLVRFEYFRPAAALLRFMSNPAFC
jgi:hypothetical protein